jgi:aryl-alcohol dehydrogenase
MQITAAVTEEQGKEYEIVDLELKEVNNDEVLIRVVSSGVCHTDVTAQHDGLVEYPAVLGHEGSGVVEKIGDAVTEFAEGDHVVMSYAHCGKCEGCLSGHPTSCQRFAELNFGGINHHGQKQHTKDGQEYSLFFGQSSFATYVVSNEQNIVKVPKDVDLTLLGPLACGIITGVGTVTEKLKVEFGADITVLGTGSVGLSAIMAANAVGANRIIAVDLNDERLELAKELGATHVINSSDPEGLGEAIKEITDGAGTDYAVDTTGVSPVIKEGLAGLKIRGELVEIGIGGEISVHLFEDLMLANKTLSSMQEGDAVPKILIPKMVDLYKKGRFPFDKLITKYDFKDINQAFEGMADGKTIKPVLVMGDEAIL